MKALPKNMSTVPSAADKNCSSFSIAEFAAVLRTPFWFHSSHFADTTATNPLLLVPVE